MDYKELLKKYMQWVEEEDEFGYDHVHGMDKCFPGERFTDEEWDALGRLSEENQS